MPIRVLIADDSSFICNRIQQILQEESSFQIVGVARNGLEAVQMAASLEPDVVTMDVEMPIMDGITAVKNIMQAKPVPILMFSSFTHSGAQVTLQALEAGAIDFLPKKLEEINANHDLAKRMLRHKVRIVSMHTHKVMVNAYRSPPVLTKANSFALQDSEDSLKKSLKLLVIVASTGGTVAIPKVLTNIPKTCRVPILLVQHMPNSFTRSFAERLNQLNNITVREAVEGDFLEPGVALLAPGGKQMEISAKKRILLRDKTAEEIYSPCADITLASVAQQFKNKALTVVMTGMGTDGKLGAEKIKQAGSQVWAQDEASCTIYGMPKAIVEANLADRIVSLDGISAAFGKIF